MTEPEVRKIAAQFVQSQNKKYGSNPIPPLLAEEIDREAQRLQRSIDILATAGFVPVRQAKSP